MSAQALAAALCILLWTAACQQQTVQPDSANTPVAARLTSAQAADGKYISWRERLIDSVELSGVPIAGSDGSVMGDLDLDGFDDIVSVHESDTQYDSVADGHLRIAFGSADPDRWESITLAEGEQAAAPEDAAIGDLNDDGYPDVVAACELAHLIYLQNPGKQARSTPWERLIPPQTLNRGAFIRVFMADFNQDGKLEVVTPNKGGQNPDRATQQVNPFLVFEIHGDPLDPKSWIEHEIGHARIPINSEPFDIDQDGDLDVMAGSRAELRVMWFENVSKKGGEIEFVEHPIDIAGTSIPDEKRADRLPKAPHALVTGFNFDYADLNHDGRIDIILREESNLVWIEQPETLDHPWPLHLIGTHYPDAMTGLNFADIDGDGRPDVITGGYSGPPRDRDGENVTRDSRVGRIAWFQNPGGDPTAQWTRHDISRRKRGMFDKFLPRDMDGDGDIDFVSTRGNSVPYDGVFWLEQVRTAEPVASFHPARRQDSEQLPLPSWE